MNWSVLFCDRGFLQEKLPFILIGGCGASTGVPRQFHIPDVLHSIYPATHLSHPHLYRLHKSYFVHRPRFLSYQVLVSGCSSGPQLDPCIIQPA